jgi:hypothetical protein
LRSFPVLRKHAALSKKQAGQTHRRQQPSSLRN